MNNITAMNRRNTAGIPQEYRKNLPQFLPQKVPQNRLYIGELRFAVAVAVKVAVTPPPLWVEYRTRRGPAGLRRGSLFLQ